MIVSLVRVVVFSISCAASFAAHAAPPVTAASFTPDGKQVVVGSQAGIEVFSWPDLQTLRRIKTSLAHVHDLAFSPDGHSLAAAGGAPAEEGGFEIFAWPDGERSQRSLPLNDVAYQLAWLGDDKLALATEEGDIVISDLEGKSLRRLEGHSRSVLSLATLPDGKHLVSASADQSVRVWNIETGALVRTLANHTAAVRDVALCPAGDGPPMIATAGADKTVRLWQPIIGRMVRFARLESAPLDIAWSPDGALLAAACEDGHLRVIDPAATKVVQDTPGIEGWAYTIALAPDGGAALIAGENGQIRRLAISPY